MKTPAFFQRSELTRILWSFRYEFFVVGVFSCVANVLMLTPTLYMLQVYDRVIISQSMLTLTVVSLLCLFLVGIMGTSEWFRSRLLVRLGMGLDRELSTRVFNASFDAYLDHGSAQPARAFSDLVLVRQFLTGQGVFAFFDAPWVPIYIGVLFLLHPWLGVMAIGFALMQVAVGWFGHRHALRPSEAAQLSFVQAQNYLQGKLRNAEVVESMGMRNNLRTQWNRRHADYLNGNDEAQAVTHRVAAWARFARYAQQSLGLGGAALLVIEGELTLGAMIASNVLMNRALAPIEQLVSTWRGIATVREAFLRLETLIAEYPERDPALRRVAPKGLLELRDVVATAEGRASPILKGIETRFAPGSVTAVLGPSGSGKSTLARVLVGIWPHVDGEVLLDGIPLAGWDRIELGPHIGYLPQDVELFDGTLAENIARFGEVDSAKVIAAARATGLHEMILRFPKGYDTPAGEAGQLLSGGQRQRIALARAVYDYPCLVVLDEPNANLDDAGEQALLETLRHLKAEGRTVVIVTHRPSALAVADQLIVLRDGAIQAQGPRDAVLAGLRAAQPPREAPAGGSALAGNPAAA